MNDVSCEDILKLKSAVVDDILQFRLRKGTLDGTFAASRLLHFPRNRRESIAALTERNDRLNSIINRRILTKTGENK